MRSSPRILAVGVEPGGAQCVAAATRRLATLGMEFSAFAKGPGVARFQALDIPVTEVDATVPEQDAATSILDRIQPDILLTGTSMGSFLERHLWSVARSRRIPSATILDAWTNFGVRFTWLDYRGIANAHPASFGEIRSDKILCPDESVAAEVRRELGRADGVATTGHPWLELVQSTRSHHSSESRSILFLSEPVLEDYGEEYWGFTQSTVLQLVVDSLLNAPSCRDVNLLVRPHPREDRSHLESILLRLEPKRWRWATEGQALDHATSASLVCGMSTMALLEAWACGCPTISIMPGLVRESPYLPDKMGWDSSVRSPASVPDEIVRRISSPPRSIPALFNHTGACGRIVEALLEMR